MFGKSLDLNNKTQVVSDSLAAKNVILTRIWCIIFRGMLTVFDLLVSVVQPIYIWQRYLYPEDVGHAIPAAPLHLISSFLLMHTYL